tara:strand:- start:622 stop:780 length:159 start_codon:yes stop_codon:yes gene_type:complete
MDQKRKRLHEVIEKAAKNKSRGSAWDLKPPKKLEIDIAPPKSTFALKRETSK